MSPTRSPSVVRSKPPCVSAFAGTSNWSENYFTQTAGVGLVVNQTGSVVESGQETLQSQAEALFHRDWTSRYASSLSLDAVDVCQH